MDLLTTVDTVRPVLKKCVANFTDIQVEMQKLTTTNNIHTRNTIHNNNKCFWSQLILRARKVAYH